MTQRIVFQNRLALGPIALTNGRDLVVVGVDPEPGPPVELLQLMRGPQGEPGPEGPAGSFSGDIDLGTFN